MDQKQLEQAVEKRRTFAIISHPDAGKTTITEQLLLFWRRRSFGRNGQGEKNGKFCQVRLDGN